MKWLLPVELSSIFMSKAATLIVGSRFGCGFCEAESLDSVVRFSFRYGARHRQNPSSAEWIVCCLAWMVLYLAAVRWWDGALIGLPCDTAVECCSQVLRVAGWWILRPAVSARCPAKYSRLLGGLLQADETIAVKRFRQSMLSFTIESS